MRNHSCWHIFGVSIEKTPKVILSRIHYRMGYSYVNWSNISGDSYRMGLWDPNNKPSLSDTSICLGPDPVTGKPISPGVDFPKDTPVFFCGYLQTTVPITLSIIWHQGPRNVHIYTNDAKDEFTQGYIYSRLNLADAPIGNYHADAYYGRDLIGTISFSIH